MIYEVNQKLGKPQVRQAFFNLPVVRATLRGSGAS